MPSDGGSKISSTHLPKIDLGGYELQITKFMVLQVVAGLLSLLIFRGLAKHIAGGKPARGIWWNFWEMLAAGVNCGILDHATTSVIARGKIIAIYENYGPYIEWRRELHGESLYSELEKLAKKLADFRRKQTEAVLQAPPLRL